MRRSRSHAWLALPVVAGLLLAACGGDGDDDDDAATTTTTAAVEEGEATTTSAGGTEGASLAGVCPERLALQTDWNPEAEHGMLYQLFGDEYEVDADRKRVSGPLMDGDTDTGITWEVQSGGPAIGFQTVTSQMYLQEDLQLGYMNTDESIQLSADQPTLSVLAPLEINPQMIMWDPGTYPEFRTVADIGETDTRVLYFGGAAYMEYLIGDGQLKREQTDGSYDGSPANFVSSGGKVAQQGFASAEPYIYENEVPEWGKPVEFQLIHDTGYPIYAAAIAIKPDDKAALAPCLERLVPIMQQAQVDYVNDPAEANELILELVEAYDTGWVYSPGVAEFSVQQQLDLGLVGNGNDDTLGNFDEERIQTVLDIVTPIFDEQGTPVREGLTAQDLFTNEFVDESIGL